MTELPGGFSEYGQVAYAIWDEPPTLGVEYIRNIWARKVGQVVLEHHRDHDHVFGWLLDKDYLFPRPGGRRIYMDSFACHDCQVTYAQSPNLTPAPGP